MAFTGKATYSAGTTLPELAEDVADLVHIISPYEAPLLETLGDPVHEATSPRHEWLEDELLPNKDAIDDATWWTRTSIRRSTWTTAAGSAWAIRSRSRAARS